MWVVSKNESNCLLENKMVSTLIWRNVILLYVVKSNILWLTFKLSYHYRCNILCTVSLLLYIATKKLKQNHYSKQFYECSYHKKITLARFACLCFNSRNHKCPLFRLLRDHFISFVSNYVLSKLQRNEEMLQFFRPNQATAH